MLERDRGIEGRESLARLAHGKDDRFLADLRDDPVPGRRQKFVRGHRLDLKFWKQTAQIDCELFTDPLAVFDARNQDVGLRVGAPRFTVACFLGDHFQEIFSGLPVEAFLVLPVFPDFFEYRRYFADVFINERTRTRFGRRQRLGERVVRHLDDAARMGEFVFGQLALQAFGIDLEAVERQVGDFSAHLIKIETERDDGSFVIERNLEGSRF